jgi:two-component system cell cycle response regulator
MARILVIEDNAINLELMRCLLGAFGHEILAATDGERGMELARSAAPELVVCDIELPGISGVEFAHRLRADPTLARLPMLAVTSNAMSGDRERLIAEGFDGYSAKPIDPHAFVPWLEAFLRPKDNAVPVILVVDDVPANRLLKRSCLEPLGWLVLAASTPSEALSMARFNPPSLIISDVGMPDGNGFDFLRAVKRVPALAGVPFIFITSTHQDPALEQRALAMGARRYLCRPMSPENLIAEIRACLASDGAVPGPRRPAASAAPRRPPAA